MAIVLQAVEFKSSARALASAVATGKPPGGIASTAGTLEKSDCWIRWMTNLDVQTNQLALSGNRIAGRLAYRTQRSQVQILAYI